MKKPNLLELLKDRLLVSDGAMGTLLYQKGIPPSSCYEYLNIIKPEIIGDIHRQYISAGAEIIETNTFAANRTKLAHFSLQDKIRDINIHGAEIAVEAAEKSGKTVYVAGSIGPAAKSLPEKILSPDEIFDIYSEQIKALEEGGVDLFILETFSNLEHIRIALEACKKISSLPVICQMAFIEGSKTSFGYNAVTIVKELEKSGADIIGANCGSGPVNTLEVVSELSKSTDKYISAQPNAGYPQLIEGRTMYLSTEEYFAGYAVLLAEAGANIIGGCCGTTPAHIKAIASRIKGIKPARRPRPEVHQEKERPVTFSLVEEKLREKKFVIVVEMSPPKNQDSGRFVEKAKILKSHGAQIISFPENPLAQVRMSSIAIASIIKKETGLETIFHYTCRDRNLIGLQSDLLGAAALGLNSVLAITGDPSSIGSNPEATSVFDLNSVKLVELISNMNKSFDLGFYTGVAFNPNVKNLEHQIERLKKKIEKGAKFAMTQPVFDADRILEINEKVKNIGIPVLYGILPLAGRKNAEFLHNEVPGISIPENIMKRMMIDDKEKAQDEGIKIALETINAVKRHIPGIYLIPPLGKYDMAVRILSEMKPEV